jgi:S-DNA-T family DNA segregation ATPase FtsK/SpoIIIE
MTNVELVGKVAIQYLRERLADDDGTEGTARYLLDCLSAKQTAAIASAVINDPYLNSRVEIKLPRNFLLHFSLPEEILTNERTTYFRNADCDKEALLLATTGDDEQQSLKEMMPIGSSQLLGHPRLWTDCVNSDIGLEEEQLKWWGQALKGLLEIQFYDLEMFAGYVLETRRQILEEGEPLLEALGLALPSLRIPRDKTFFNVLNEKNAGHLARWKTLYNKAIRQRSCYMKKYTPTQGLLTQDQLLKAFEKVKDNILSDYHDLINSFICTDSGWNQSSKDLCDCEWEGISQLFDGLKKEKFNLGKKTIEFYDDRDPILLNEDERDYLESLSKRNSTSSSLDPSDETFYEDHRLDLREDSFLKAKWDQFIFGKPVECEDFLAGLVTCFERLFSDTNSVESQKLIITCDRKTKQDLKRLNFEAGEYFSFRYQGLPQRLGNGIEWDTGKLFEFQDLLTTWRKESKTKLNRSVAKASLRIKFYLTLQVKLLNGNDNSITKQLIWQFNPNAVAAELPGDWGRLHGHPMSRCFASRETISGKGNVQSIDLKDSKTLHASYAQDRGSFVPVYKREGDIAAIWKNNLEEAFSQGLLNSSQKNDMLASWTEFESKYSQAIQEFNSDGFLAEGIRDQYEIYGELIHRICEQASGDRIRALLLHPLLDIGTAQIAGDKVTAIIAPWHPLRLFAMDIKIQQVSCLLGRLLSSDEIHFSDPRLYFKEITEGLQHPYYPDLAIGWDGQEPKLLACTDHNLDYSLHENPLAEDDGLDETNESPSVTAALVLDLIKKYLKLYPHEKANLSTVLFNCDCSRLPIALVDKVAELHEDEDDMRCEVILRHRDNGTLINLYERIIEASDEDVDSFIASEATTDFMARLRIGIMADQAPVPDPKDGRPTDIVFLQDVIARHAQVEWYSDESEPIDELDLVPSQWSRRKPSAKDEMKSVVYLTCPIQTRIGWNYVSALSSIMKPHMTEPGKHLLPARQLNFNDAQTAEIFEEIHQLGNWVANYDELLDRRQLINQRVRVIRYKQTSSQGRNLLISSQAPLTLLKSMVKGRINNLNITLSQEPLDNLTERFIDDANKVSGDLVLRAAKRGRNASELMGVVLSKYLIEDELGPGSLHGWFFLDDYAEWLGQKEEQIADLLALCPIIDNGTYKLGIIISEAKYIDYSSLSAKRKESQKQLRDTVRRIREALLGEQECMDRSLWLSRLSNLVMSGVHVTSNDMENLSKWRDALRRGDCEVFIRGYSHVFISGPSDSPECSDFTAVAELEDAYQEVFSRAKVKTLLQAYIDESSVSAIRKANADHNVWEEPCWRKVSESKEQTSKHASEEIVKKPTPEASRIPENKPEPGSEHEADSRQTPSVPPESVTGNGFASLICDLQSQFPINQQRIDDAEGWLQKTGNSCKGALQQFQLKSKLIGSRLTPNCALLKFEGSANLTVDQVRKRQSEFLTSHGLDITSVKAEPGIVSISIARPQREILLLQNIWNNWKVSDDTRNTSLLIGVKEEDGSPLFFSPQKNAPHTLVAGSTGSGKSVLIQNIVLGIAATNTPDNAEITIIDPKMVDYQDFNPLPHVKEGIIDDMDKAVQKLDQLIAEMNRRYLVLKQNKVKDITGLNSKPNATEKLPYIWVIHDEFAEWMMIKEYKEAVAKTVGRLGVKARAAGIFLIFAAQRPDDTVMPLQLRSQLGNRLVLRVDGAGTSEISLGIKNAGAERLMGKGHLAAKLEGEADIILAQVPFIEDCQIEFLVSKIAVQYN